MREWIGGLDMVSREEFEAVKAIAVAAREENAGAEGAGSRRSRPRRRRSRSASRRQGRKPARRRGLTNPQLLWSPNAALPCALARARADSLRTEADRDSWHEHGRISSWSARRARPIDMLEHYFSALGWAYERNGEDEIVSNFQGSWTQYELRAIWRDEDHVLQFLALPDIRVAADKRAATYETIGLINEQLWLGHFELWSASRPGPVPPRRPARGRGGRRRSACSRPRPWSRRRSRNASASTRSSSSCSGPTRPRRKRSPPP